MKSEMPDSITDGPQYDDEQIRLEPDPDERDELSLAMIDTHVAQVKHDFPLATQIKGLLIEISETDRVPVEQTIDVLHKMLAYLETSTKLVTALSDDIEKVSVSIRGSLYQGDQS